MTNTSTEEFWLIAEKSIQTLLNKFTSLLDSESMDAVQYYIDRDEYEMAFEGLFIELMKAKAFIDKSEMELYLKLGQDLGLDEDSVFDSNFWNKFKIYVEQK